MTPPESPTLRVTQSRAGNGLPRSLFHGWSQCWCAIGLLVASLSASPDAFPRFENVTELAGLDFVLVSGSTEKHYILESMSGGVGLIDFDGDGWLDVYLVNGSTLEVERSGERSFRNALFRNEGGERFTEVTLQAGVGDRGWGMGVCVADVDGNGHDDLYVTNFGPNVLYLNQGDGTFREVSAQSGVDDPSWSASAAFADYDGDGDVDLYVTNYVDFDIQRPPPTNSPQCEFRGILVQCGPKGLPAHADRFFENEGAGVFAEKTQQAGLGKVPRYFGLGVVWGDYDSDGDPDIYVANDTNPNFLFRNNGDRSFSELGLLAGVALNQRGKEQAGMGVDFSDTDQDQDLDLFVTNFAYDFNTLYRNENDGFFSDVTRESGLAEGSWLALGWGAWFVDLDLDGLRDLVIANGHVFPQVDEHQMESAYRQRNLVYRNQGSHRFQEVSDLAGPGFREQRISRGLAAGDLNNDGHMDLLISNLGEKPSLLLNRRVAANWILLKLKGRKSNRSGIGARVWLKSGDLEQMQETKSGGSYLSQSDPRVHFGLGQRSSVDRIRIRWPSGILQQLENVSANQILTVTEPED